MGKQIRKGATVSTRATFPVSGLMSDDSLARLRTVSENMHKGAAQIRAMHK